MGNGLLKLPDLLLNKAHFPVTVLGPGKRAGIWVQGCSLGCEGCISRDTWDKEQGRSTSIGELCEWIVSCAEMGATGLSISGGEPFQQSVAVEALLDQLSKLVDRDRFDVLIYSGYSLGFLEKHHRGVLAKCDALVSEPYVATKGEGEWLRGSANQRITAYSRLGEERYADPDVPTQSAQPSIQLAVDEDAVWYIGIPRPNDMDRLEQFAALRGVELEGGTWLS
jgi:anaerobic ribonucleoside-triphosphate reductase activating protein